MTTPLSDPPVASSDDVASQSTMPRTWRAVASNVAWLNGERAIDLAITLLVTVLVARYLGPDGFGTIGYLVGLSALISSLVPLGMDRLLVFELVSNPRKAGRLLGTSTALKLCSGSIMGLLMVAAVPLLNPSLDHALLFGALFGGSIVTGAFNWTELVFTARTQARYAVLSSTMARIAMALVRLILIYAAASLTAFVSSTAIEPVLTILLLFLIYLMRVGGIGDWRFDGELAANLLWRGFPLMLASLATALLMRLGIVMLEQLSGETAAGLYSSATRISDTCGLVANSVIISVAPTLIAIRSRSAEQYRDAIARLMQGVSASMCLVALALFFVSDQLIRILLGAAFSGAADVLRIYIWSSVPIALGLVQTQWLINEGYERFIFARSVAGAAANFAANLLLIPRYGAVGAAYAAVIAQTISCVLMNLVCDARTRQMFLLQLKSLAFLNIGLLLARQSPPTEA